MVDVFRHHGCRSKQSVDTKDLPLAAQGDGVDRGHHHQLLRRGLNTGPVIVVSARGFITGPISVMCIYSSFVSRSINYCDRHRYLIVVEYT